MAPVLLSCTPTGDGRSVVVWSVRPGRRVSVVAASDPVTDSDLAAMLTAVIPLLERKEHT